ncbi:MULTISPECIES: type II toxin-antitoxin system VapB family antitoxin [Chromohalobacter]|uniref:AbrB/MazE/SpoVT family DNA-binding domain-containing protein n=1 Tax=Chromohalobacter moromii TaxID=2860329 RepID=A0A9X2X514_9GAMM|nr:MULTISPECIES: type II toxin-antitoxin system VapB family antitoxin [Chromohalobacter]MCK2047140.1 AbrB/MazE/SpoVT family DNA-binding domain-containing protein [Chromohalobacter moromii]MCT8468080.1 AbrB/MazE/SpoVT family DNA-binding domain-containing protein [Chromohalobacter canadensis]MCT8498579.1 AbrB/MazE/SpoVT family DNA-binding domain-containing protein [Chromohalobacter canadensis]MCT8506825.1 AbrB/MazE/SpoVT family DNA-binding domain-containing protein [Chromohalobacter moromii]
MPQGSVFHSQRHQTIRLPRESAFLNGVKRIEIISIGETRILIPEGNSWDEWFDGQDATADFFNTRD